MHNGKCIITCRRGYHKKIIKIEPKIKKHEKSHQNLNSPKKNLVFFSAGPPWGPKWGPNLIYTNSSKFIVAFNPEHGAAPPPTLQSLQHQLME